MRYWLQLSVLVEAEDEGEAEAFSDELVAELAGRPDDRLASVFLTSGAERDIE